MPSKKEISSNEIAELGGGGKPQRTDERRRMEGYVRKRDRWGAREQVEAAVEASAGPSLYNDTLH